MCQRLLAVTVDFTGGSHMAFRGGSRSLLVVVLAWSLSGCSWAFMNRAPEPVAAPNYPVDCTDSRAAPVLDTICSGYFVVNGLVIAGAKSCDSALPGESCIESGAKTAGVIGSLALAALCGFSAGSGFGYASKCTSVKATNSLCITGNEDACKKLNPAWTPPLKVPAAAAAPAAAGAATWTDSGCAKDTDCKGNRVCDKGTCVDPPPKAEPAPAR
jgi:hypothetical protein